MKIAMIVKNFINNGIGTVVLNYSLYLEKMGYSVDILVAESVADNKYYDIKGTNITIIQLPSKQKNLIQYYRSLYHILKNNNYSLAHIHGNSGAVFPEIICAKKAHLPVVCHSHNTRCNHPNIHRMFRRFVSILTDARVACSREAGEWLFGKYDYLVLPNAFCVDNFRYNVDARKSLREELDIDEHTLVIGNVARLNPQKNLLFLLDIFEEFHTNYPNSILIIVGDGPLYDTLNSRVASSNLSGNVIITGDIPDPSGYYSLFDIFVFPSLYEGLGISLVEAQISGLPCIVSDKVPEDAHISNLYYSLKLSANSKQWVSMMYEISEDIRTRERKSCNAAKFDIKTNVLTLSNVYQSICVNTEKAA